MCWLLQSWIIPWFLRIIWFIITEWEIWELLLVNWGCSNTKNESSGIWNGFVSILLKGVRKAGKFIVKINWAYRMSYLIQKHFNAIPWKKHEWSGLIYHLDYCSYLWRLLPIQYSISLTLFRRKRFLEWIASDSAEISFVSFMIKITTQTFTSELKECNVNSKKNFHLYFSSSS